MLLSPEFQLPLTAFLHPETALQTQPGRSSQGEDPEFPNGEANSEPYPVTRVYNLGFNVNF